MNVLPRFCATVAVAIGLLVVTACTYKPITVTIPECYPSCVAGCVPTGAEACDNGLDDDCDGQYDEDCTCAAGANQSCGTDVGACTSGMQECVDGRWGACAGVVGPTPEVCDGGDNNCDGQTDEGCACSDGATQPCGEPAVGDCTQGEQTCAGGVWGACAGGVDPTPELCDDHDNNCNGSTDEGCDDDGDGYCDATMAVVGTPAVCPSTTSATLRDCDDGAAGTYPGAVEICANGVDTDCDGDDAIGDDDDCPFIGIRIVDPPGPVEVPHGQPRTLRAELTPALDPAAWPCTWTVVQADGSACSTSDVTLAPGTHGPGYSLTSATMPNQAAQLGCVYTIEVKTHAYACAKVKLTVVNRPPEILEVNGATRDGEGWRLDLSPNLDATGVRVMATVRDDDDTTVTVRWLDAAGTPLADAALGPLPTTTAPPVGGVVSATWPDWSGSALALRLLEVTDPLGAATTVPVRIYRRTCVWANASGYGNTGTGPQTYQAFGTITEALNTAGAGSDTAVCLSGVGIFNETVTLGAGDPDLLGGFNVDGVYLPSIIPTVQHSGTVLQMTAGYAGILRRLMVSGPGTAPVLRVSNASPRVSRCEVHTTEEGSLTAVEVSNSGGTQDTFPIFDRTSVRRGSTAFPTETFTAFALTGRGSAPARVEIRDSPLISALNCTESCRAVSSSGMDVTLTGNELIEAGGASGEAIAIMLDGFTDPMRATIARNLLITTSGVAPAGPQRTASIALRATNGVEIRDNVTIGGGWGYQGSEAAFGILDGFWDVDGALQPGGSTGLVVRDNGHVSPGARGAFVGTCSAGNTGEGPAITAGVLLWGSVGALVTGNGRPATTGSGIWGGVGSAHWAAAGSTSPPPVAVGLWTLQTSDVHVVGNELRSGVLVPRNNCTTSADPALPVVALRDGSAVSALETQASVGLLIDGNGIVCSNRVVDPRTDLDQPGISSCVGVELHEPTAVDDNLTVLTNNYVAAMRGPRLHALSQRGGAGVMAVNNTFDSGVPPGGGDEPGGRINHAIALEQLEEDGLSLVNDMILARGGGDDAERFAIHELAESTESKLHMLKNCQLWVTPADPGANTVVSYVRVKTIDNSWEDYDDDELDELEGLEWLSGNLTAPPGWVEAITPEGKSSVRLSPYLPAVNAGHDTWSQIVLPEVDLEGDSRQTNAGWAPDIGHDELVQGP